MKAGLYDNRRDTAPFIWHLYCFNTPYGGIMKLRNGFTVIELLVTLAVFSIILMITIGLSVDQARRAGLKGNSNELVGEINTVRGRAAKENRAVALTFTSTTFKEHFYENGVWNPDLSNHSAPAGNLSEGISFKNTTTVAFNSQGILINPNTLQIRGNITLTLESTEFDGIKIKIYPYGGIKVRNTWRNSDEYASF